MYVLHKIMYDVFLFLLYRIPHLLRSLKKHASYISYRTWIIILHLVQRHFLFWKFPLSIFFCVHWGYFLRQSLPHKIKRAITTNAPVHKRQFRPIWCLAFALILGVMNLSCDRLGNWYEPTTIEKNVRTGWDLNPPPTVYYSSALPLTIHTADRASDLNRCRPNYRFLCRLLHLLRQTFTMNFL